MRHLKTDFDAKEVHVAMTDDELKRMHLSAKFFNSFLKLGKEKWIEIMEEVNNFKMLVNIDIKDNRPHKAVRLYDVSGKAIGHGEAKVLDKPEENSLFTAEAGFMSYLVDLDLDALRKSIESAKKPKPVSEQKSDLDVEASNDPDEDEWVRKALYQLKAAKSKINLMTISELREDYRKMKHGKVKSNDDTMKEEPAQVPNAEKRSEDIINEIEKMELGKVDDNPLEKYEKEEKESSMWDKLSDVGFDDSMEQRAKNRTAIPDEPMLTPPQLVKLRDSWNPFHPISVWVKPDDGEKVVNGKEKEVEYYIADKTVATYTYDQMMVKKGIHDKAKAMEKEKQEVGKKKDEPQELNLDDFLKGL